MPIHNCSQRYSQILEWRQIKSITILRSVLSYYITTLTIPFQLVHMILI